VDRASTKPGRDSLAVSCPATKRLPNQEEKRGISGNAACNVEERVRVHVRIVVLGRERSPEARRKNFEGFRSGASSADPRPTVTPAGIDRFEKEHDEEEVARELYDPTWEVIPGSKRETESEKEQANEPERREGGCADGSRNLHASILPPRT
jgi:hypothetical protein